MIDSITKVIVTAFIVTALYVAVRPTSQAPKVISALTGGVVSMQKAATGA